MFRKILYPEDIFKGISFYNDILSVDKILDYIQDRDESENKDSDSLLFSRISKKKRRSQSKPVNKKRKKSLRRKKKRKEKIKRLRVLKHRTNPDIEIIEEKKDRKINNLAISLLLPLLLTPFFLLLAFNDRDNEFVYFEEEIIKIPANETHIVNLEIIDMEFEFIEEKVPLNKNNLVVIVKDCYGKIEYKYTNIDASDDYTITEEMFYLGDKNITLKKVLDYPVVLELRPIEVLASKIRISENTEDKIVNIKTTVSSAEDESYSACI